MSESEMSEDQKVEAIYALAAEQMHSGITPARIQANLIEKGLDAESAAAVVDNLKEAQNKVNQEVASKNMRHGALWCIGGLLVTGLSYLGAEGGGKYMVAWGAVVYGAIQFFRGVAQSSGE